MAEHTGIQRSEHSPELSGIAGTNAFYFHDSASRLQMYCSHIGQSLGVLGATIKRLMTGAEREYAKYTFNIKMPCNAYIHKVIRKYPPTIGLDAIKENPLTIIVYEDLDSPKRDIGILEIPRHHCIHQYYGFPYVLRPGISTKLTVGANIPKGTVIADSPLVTPDGDYKYGLESNVAMMSLHLNIEDGVVISKSYAKRLTTKGFGSRSISWGKNRYPLNLKGYGTVDKPSAFPEIGSRIRADGLLFALREYDDLLGVVDLTPKALQTPDYNFDKLVYAEPNAKVVDVIIHQGNQMRSSIPTGLGDQCNRYMERTNAYYASLLEIYNTLRKQRGEALYITPQFQRLLVEATAMCADDSHGRVTHTFNRNPLDEWRVEVVYEFDVVPNIGAKVTDCHGGKGVVCAIWDDERMPVDKHGNRAEVIVDDTSTVKRMNIGRLYEQYFNAVGDQVRRDVTVAIGNRTAPEVEKAWQIIMNHYRILSPVMHQMVEQSDIVNDKLRHVEEVIKDGIYMYLPTDTPVNYLDVVDIFDAMYPDLTGPLSYIGDSGKRTLTHSKILIGSMYILLLEKTGNTWSGVSSSKLQHFGIPAKLTNEDKYAAPGRAQPVRIWGEAEVRLNVATDGGRTAADILDQTNNPLAHKAVLYSILHADKPSNIQSVINRSEIPMGKGRMHAYVFHFLECAGIRFQRRRNQP